MDFHEIDLKGKIWIERVSTLPTWTINDVGRVLYVTGEDEYYKGSASSWTPFTSLGADSTALQPFRGLAIRPYFEYATTSSISISPGRYHINGSAERILQWAADLSFTFSGLTANAWHYLYINGAIASDTLTAAYLLNSTTAPTFNGSYGGWYSGANRCIGAFYTNASAQLTKFYHSNDYFKWDLPYTIYSGNPSTSWTTVSLYLPTFSKFASCIFYQSSGNDGKNVYFYWRQGGSSSSGFLIGRHYVDDGGDNQGNHQSIVSDIVTGDSSRQIQVRTTGAGYSLTVYQTGYHLPYGM